MLRSLQQSKLFTVVAALMLAATVVFSLACPLQAYALDVEKCTARANQDGGAGVLGATETRVTWEAQADASESITALTFTLPAGTTFEVEDTRVTQLMGEDLMDREFLDAECTQSGDELSIVLDQPAAAGSYVRVEIYGVRFPAEGGSMVLTGTYQLTDSSVHNLPDAPAIEVIALSVPEQISNWLADQSWVQAWNSVNFLHLFFDPTIMATSFPVVFSGFLQALVIVAIAFPLAIPCGLILAFMRMSKLRILRAIGTTYVNVVRGTPLFLQIYIAFFGLPLAGINPPPILLGVVVLAMNSSAYLCEIFRAGIQSISAGQFEAAASLGMNRAQTMFYVIIPQTVRRVIPTMTSEFILLYKDTSLLAAVGIMEVVMYARTIVAATGSITPYIVAAIFYLIITLPLAKIVGNFEAKLASKDGGTSNKKNRKNKKKDQPQKVDANDDQGITPAEISSL